MGMSATWVFSTCLGVSLLVSGCTRRNVDQSDVRSSGVSDASPSSSARPRRARSSPVVITIVVDQLAAWIAEERWPKLPASGGFARLMREGTYVKELRYAHAVTDTAPGHAALYTGAVPRESGIFGNEVVDTQGDVGSIVRDAATRLVYPSAIEPAVGSSAARLRVDTVADRLRASAPDAFVASISIKDRGAILPGGKKPNGVVWLDTKQVRFVTSSAFAEQLPKWAEARGEQPSVLRALGMPWERLHPELSPMTPDDQAGEGDESGLGRTFPHRMEAVTAPGRVFRTLPASDDVLLGLGLDAVGALGADDADAGSRTAPVLVALSLSANDYVGHVFGPDSWEAWEEIATLDRALARFFDALDRHFGADGWAALLTGDHGTIHMPETARVPGVRPWCQTSPVTPDVFERPCGETHRIDLDALGIELASAAKRVLPGKNDLVRGTADPYVFLGDGARALSKADRKKLDGALRHVLARTPGVRRVFAVDDLPETCPPLEGDDVLAEEARIDALVCRSVAPKVGEHAGGYYVLTQRGSFFDPRIVRGFGTSHGTPYLYDRAVPLLVRAPKRVPQGRVISAPVDFRAFARTTASLLDIAPPLAASGGRDLTR